MIPYQIALSTTDGRILAARGGDGETLTATNTVGVGPWEIFRLFNRSRPGHTPQHVDKVVLQSNSGHFVSVAESDGDLSATLSWIESAAIFTLRRMRGRGRVETGDQVALQAANLRYVSASGRGEGTVRATAERIGTDETLIIRMYSPQLIRLRAPSGRFITPEDGGGREVVADRTVTGLWETVSLTNLSRHDGQIRSGDSIALQAWNGNYIRTATSGTIEARANHMTRSAQFRIGSVDPPTGQITHGSRVTLQSMETLRFIVERGGTLAAEGAIHSAASHFQLEFAARSGIESGWLSDGSALRERPLAAPATPTVGIKRIFVIHIHSESQPPLTASNLQIEEALFGTRPSLADWVRTMSNGLLEVRSAGVFGPIRVPPGDIPLSEVLAAAESQGVPLASLATRGVIDGREIGLLRLGVGNGGQMGHFDETTPRGIRYIGPSAGVGVSPDIDERARMVIGHEASHMYLDVIDRYHLPRPVRGDVIATSESPSARETFIIQRVDGNGDVRSGDRVRLKLLADPLRTWAAPSSPPQVVTTKPADTTDESVFIIECAAGRVSNNATIYLRTAAGRYVTSEYGGASVMTANRTARGDWEAFKIRQPHGADAIRSGHEIALKTKLGFWVCAEPGAGDDIARLEPHEMSAWHRWTNSSSAQGGGFDNATSNYESVMLSVFDRIRLGWVKPKYVTPTQRGSYLIRPFLNSRDAIILFDPLHPAEWYTVENRQYTEGIDEVPSNGIVVSWINEDRGYWQWWFSSRRDTHAFDAKARYPVVISAMAAHVPPNPLAAPIILAHEWLYKRNHPNAAFTNQELVLPRGNGDPSRFHVSFHPADDRNIAICVR